jgi:hypothetical protein
MSERDPMNPADPLDEFEHALKRALRPVNAPETLAKFLASAAEAKAHQQRAGRFWFARRLFPERKPGGRLLVLPWPPAWTASALAAMLLLGALAGEQVHVGRQHERAEMAQQQFETSMHITDRALDQAREQLARAGVLRDE